MKRIKKIRNKHSLHPIFSYCLLIFAIIVLSGVLNLFNVTTTYNKISNNGTYVRELVSSQNLFSLHGLKIIFSNAVSNFASFTPLSMLIITLIGIGIMDKTGFLDSFFYILTRKTNKKIVTFVLSFICILSSISGDLGFIAPFDTFNDDEKPADPLSKEVINWMSKDNINTVPWVFQAFPSQNFKDTFASALLEYVQGTQDWNYVVNTVKDSWKAEKAQ